MQEQSPEVWFERAPDSRTRQVGLLAQPLRPQAGLPKPWPLAQAPLPAKATGLRERLRTKLAALRGRRY